MNLIKPSLEIWEQNDIWEHIAKCTRVCYQSTPRENGETNEEFVRRVILHSSTGEQDFSELHGAMLEHGTVYLSWLVKFHEDDTQWFAKNKYSRVIVQTLSDGDKAAYITTNMRVIIENHKEYCLNNETLPTIHIPRITVSFITNIGVTREFNRHRVNSIAEESTRYCNYSKLNNGNLNIVIPAWLYNEESLPYIETHQYDNIASYAEDILENEDDTILEKWCDIDFYLSAITFAEWHYNMLIKKGWTAQRAREVLPLATKTQLIHTAFIDDWIHFIKLRAIGVSGNPHPNAKILASDLYKKLVDLDLCNPIK